MAKNKKRGKHKSKRTDKPKGEKLRSRKKNNINTRGDDICKQQPMNKNNGNNDTKSNDRKKNFIRLCLFCLFVAIVVRCVGIQDDLTFSEIIKALFDFLKYVFICIALLKFDTDKIKDLLDHLLKKDS